VVLAELSRHITAGPQQGGDGGVFGLHPFGGTGEPDFGQSGADGRLPGNERPPVQPCSFAVRTSR
jgi:hypothetical protein